MALKEGEIFEKRYRIIKKLSETLLCTTYHAEDISLCKELTLKVMNPIQGALPDNVKRFKKEAHILSIITHPNVCRVYDYNKSKSGHFLTMEYLEGEKLSAIIQNKRPLPLTAVMDIMRQLLGALQNIHSMNFVHADLKPDNIIVTKYDDINPIIKLTEFGNSVDLNEHHSKKSPSRSEHHNGTPAYFSPEQAADSKAIDQRSDLYTCGIILYEMLTGKSPFKSPTNSETIGKQINEMAPHLPPLSATYPQFTDADKLDDIIQKLLAKKPKSRYQSAEEVLKALKQVKITSVGTAVENTDDQKNSEPNPDNFPADKTDKSEDSIDTPKHEKNKSILKQTMRIASPMAPDSVVLSPDLQEQMAALKHALELSSNPIPSLAKDAPAPVPQKLEIPEPKPDHPANPFEDEEIKTSVEAIVPSIVALGNSGISDSIINNIQPDAIEVEINDDNQTPEDDGMAALFSQPDQSKDQPAASEQPAREPNPEPATPSRNITEPITVNPLHSPTIKLNQPDLPEFTSDTPEKPNNAVGSKLYIWMIAAIGIFAIILVIAILSSPNETQDNVKSIAENTQNSTVSEDSVDQIEQTPELVALNAEIDQKAKEAEIYEKLEEYEEAAKAYSELLRLYVKWQSFQKSPDIEKAMSIRSKLKALQQKAEEQKQIQAFSSISFTVNGSSAQNLTFSLCDSQSGQCARKGTPMPLPGEKLQVRKSNYIVSISGNNVEDFSQEIYVQKDIETFSFNLTPKKETSASNPKPTSSVNNSTKTTTPRTTTRTTSKQTTTPRRKPI